jgi:glutamine amidotransferase
VSGRVAIIDSGGANIASLTFAFERLGIEATLTRDADIISAADRVLLPGVGAARDSMLRLREAGLIDVIRSLTQPVLGICLGMQLLADASEEDDTECLGVIPGIARKLAASVDAPVPNMGWCPARHDGTHPILAGIPDGAYFYFVHSYALPVTEYTVATAAHSRDFSAVVAKDNFVAAQFHPERSARYGAMLIHNFIRSGT